MRINKYLAMRHISTRREADEVVASGRVKINGRAAVLGDKVKEDDLVEVAKENKRSAKKRVYLAYNKPTGIITHSPQGEERSIGDIFKYDEKVFPVGRLDKDSWGLIILANDGRITDRILNPERDHEKEYIVRVDKPISVSFIGKMGRGVKLDDGYQTKACRVKKMNEYDFSIVLTEGKKRQIRRMCTMLGYAVRDLKRVRIMNVKLGDLRPGAHRRLKGEELETFLKKLNLEK
ncbi:MAG: Pseudouridine synthase [Patescibacteria group bacterium]|nr:Pseudouridine synthase [Patescibacteria group bacterium]